MFRKKSSTNHIDDNALTSPWYLKDATTSEVKQELDGQADGSFVIKDSASQPGNFQLSYMYQGAIKNSHIEGTSAGIHLTKSVKKFPCLTELVRFYVESDNGDMLCQLTGAALPDKLDPKELKKQLKNRQQDDKRRSKALSEPAEKGGKWKVGDVCEWLSQMEMGEYVSSFKKNKIDGTALLSLQDQDLKELGVMILGQRKKLLQAIQTLNDNIDQAANKGPAPGAAKPVATIGLVARNVNGQVKIFDVDTGEEVHDIAAHQARKQEEAQNGGGGGPPPSAPPPVQRPPPPQPAPTPSSGGGGGGAVPTNEEWYIPNLQKNEISGHLQGKSNGEFVVRDSASSPGSYAFSYQYNGKVLHNLINPNGGGYSIKGSDQQFPTVMATIDHYANNASPPMKCKLAYPGAIQVGGSSGSDSYGGPAWDCLLLTKQEALAKIAGKPQGSFVIRPSDKAYAAMSMVKPDGSQFHQHIEELGNGKLRLKKSTVEHASLADFVIHFSSPSQSDLPCNLVEI